MILLKSIMYRVWQSVITFLIALTVTHKFETAAQIVGLEVLFKIFTYWVFEKLWKKAVNTSAVNKQTYQRQVVAQIT